MKPAEVLALLDQEPGVLRRVPVSTYRIQFDPRFTFADLRAVVPYLSQLGVTDCYLPPFLQPCSERSHGYDIADHNRFNAVLGSEADYLALCETLREHGMGQLIDVVPNHMGISGSRNVWWLDVLENGPASPYAAYFDIDWEPVKPELRNKVLLPTLSDQYGRALESQELVLDFQDGAFHVRYRDNVFPIAPDTYPTILRSRLGEFEESLGKDHPHVMELQSILTALQHLPPQTETDPERLVERNREKQIIKRRLETLTRESPEIKAFILENIRILNGVKGDRESFDRLDELLSAQAYRPAFWQVAADEINYRRFFDINELAAIRMEEPAVFEEAHRLIFQLVREGHVTGLRIDHIDGLYAPAQYLRGLQRRCVLELARRLAGHAPESEPPGLSDAVLAEFDRRVAGNPRSARARPFYIVAEKILMPGEPLPEQWPIFGTTGYDFLNALNGIFIYPEGEREITESYLRFVGGGVPFPEIEYESKKLITDTTMSSEINVLAHRLDRISEKHRSSRDFTLRSLTTTLREVMACFPVYRTYIGDTGFEVTERDRRCVEQAVALARRKNPALSAALFDFVRDILCLRFPEAPGEADRLEHQTLVMKFQQLIGPITAKGVEDTALYRYNRLISLNEVGGSPGRFGLPLAEFYRLNAERQARWPWSLSATSTHDAKRGEDVRARINVLSEIPREWRNHLHRWHRLNQRYAGVVEGQTVPDPNEEYLLYQTLLGAWPFEPVSEAAHAEFVERVQQYIFKALREAKVHASWINPHPEYDAVMRRFIAAILDRSRRTWFLDDFLPFQRRIAEWGVYNSLSQTLLKLAAPGVPNFYQGTELWDLNLVDPDNRRPVDYARRRQMLGDLVRAIAEASPDLAALAQELVNRKEDGAIKLYVIHRGLTFRRDHARLFLDGEYVPLEAGGVAQGHLCAFARRLGAETVVAAASRLLVRLGVDGPPLGRRVWGKTWLWALPEDRPGQKYRNLFTAEGVEVVERDGRPALPAETILGSFPVALLVAEGRGSP